MTKPRAPACLGHANASGNKAERQDRHLGELKKISVPHLKLIQPPWVTKDKIEELCTNTGHENRFQIYPWVGEGLTDEDKITCSALERLFISAAVKAIFS